MEEAPAPVAEEAAPVVARRGRRQTVAAPPAEVGLALLDATSDEILLHFICFVVFVSCCSQYVYLSFYWSLNVLSLHSNQNADHIMLYIYIYTYI